MTPGAAGASDFTKKLKTIDPPAQARAGDWKVSPISYNSGDGLNYCSMKATYEDGYMLVFARNEQGVNSLAVDFGRDDLEEGRKYGVILGVLPHVTRQMTAVAATPRVLIMQLGRDVAFYDAVRQYDKMAVLLPSSGESVAFSLDGTSRALNGLDACLAEISPSYIPEGDRQMMAEWSPGSDYGYAGIEPASGTPGLQISVEKPGGQDAGGGVFDSPVVEDKGPAATIGQADVMAAEIKALALEKKTMEARFEAEAKKLELERALGQEALVRKEAEVAALKTALEEARKQRPLTAAVPESRNEARADASAVSADADKTVSDRLREIIVAVHPSGNVIADEAYAGAGRMGYSWQADGVFGAAQRIGHEGGNDLSSLAVAYEQRARDLCPGDFAASGSRVEKIGGLSVRKAEIACIGGAAESMAALLFVDDGHVLTVISHETAPDLARSALIRRDAVHARLSAVGSL